MGLSPDDKRRRARKRRRGEVDEKKIVIVKAFRKLQGAIEDLARSASSRKRSHSSSSSSTSDSSASSSSSSSTSSSGSSTSTASSSEEENRRHRRVSERSRSRSRLRRYRKKQNGGLRRSRSKSHRKSRSRVAKYKPDDKKSSREANEPRKKRKIDDSRHESLQRMLQDSEDNGQSVKSQSEAGTSGLAVKTCSDLKKTDSDCSKSQNRSGDETKHNKDKVVQKTDNREALLSCRQVSEGANEDCQDKSEHLKKTDIDVTVSASKSLNNDDKSHEKSQLVVEICSDDKKTDKKEVKSPDKSRHETKQNKDNVVKKSKDGEALLSSRQNSSDRDKYSHETDINASESSMIFSVDGSSINNDTKKKETKLTNSNEDTIAKKIPNSSEEQKIIEDDISQSKVDVRDNNSDNTTEIICSKTQIDSTSSWTSGHFVDGTSRESNDNEKNVECEDCDENQSKKNISTKSGDDFDNINDISQTVNSVDCKIDKKVENKLQEIVDKVLESLHEKDHHCDKKIALLTEKRDQNIEVVKNDEIFVSNDSDNSIGEGNEAETTLKSEDDDREKVDKKLKEKEEAIDKDSMLSNEETSGMKIDPQKRNAQRNSGEDESSDDLLQDLLSWFPQEEFADVYSSDDSNEKATNGRKNPEEKVQEVLDAEVVLKVEAENEKIGMTSEEDDILMGDEEIFKNNKTNNVVCSLTPSEKYETCKFDGDKRMTNTLEEDEHRSEKLSKKPNEIIKKNDGISLEDKSISNKGAKVDKAEEFVLKFLENNETTNKEEKSSEFKNVELVLETSSSESEISRDPTEKEESVICEIIDEEIEKQGKLEEVDTTIQEKKETQKLDEVDEKKIEGKVEENLLKNVEKCLQINEPMVIEESPNCDDGEESEDSKDSGHDSSEEVDDKMQQKVPIVVFRSLLKTMCGFLISETEEDKLPASKTAPEVENHPKNDSTSADVSVTDSSGKNEENIVPEDTSTSSELQSVSPDHRMTEKITTDSEESVSQPKLSQESNKKSSKFSEVSRILATVVQPFTARKNIDVDEKLPPANCKSSEKSVKEFSLQATENFAEKESGIAIESSAVEKDLVSREIKDSAVKEPQMTPKFTAESAEEIAERKSANFTEKVLLTSEFPAESAKNFVLLKTAILAEKEKRSVEERALQENGNDLGKETQVVTIFTAESAEKLTSETENLDENDASMTSELPPKLSEEFPSEETEKTTEKDPSVAPELPAVSPVEFLPSEIRDFTDREFMEVEVTNSVTEATENTFPCKSDEKIEENVPAANSTVETITTDLQEDAEDTPKEVEQKIEEHVPAANSTVEIVTTDHQEDAEITQKMGNNRQAEQKIKENLPVANSMVEMIINNHQEDTENTHKAENEQTQQELEENVPSVDSTVEIVTTDYRANAEDTQKVEINKTQRKIEENVPAANSVVEIVTTDYKEDADDTQEVEKKDAEQNLPRKTDQPILSAVEEILRSALEKFGIARKNYLAKQGLTMESLAELVRQDSEDFDEMVPMTPESPSESTGDFNPSETEDSAEAFELSEAFPPQKISVFTEKSEPIAPEISSQLSEEFPPLEIDAFTQKSTSIAPEISSKSSEEFHPQETQNLDKKESLVTPNLSAESSKNNVLRETEKSTEKELLTAPNLSTESQVVPSHDKNGLTGKEQFVASESSTELSNVFTPEKTEDFEGKESFVALETPVESPEEVSSLENADFAEKLPTESVKEIPSRKIENLVEMVLELPPESSQEFSSQGTGNSAEDPVSMTLKLPEESLNEFSSQETKSSAEKELSVVSKFPEKSSQEFPSQETENFAEKESTVTLKFPVQPTEEYSSQQVENLAEKEKSVSPESPKELSQDFASQDTENLSEVTPMEIDSPEVSVMENTSSDSSLTIISKVEADREDYESLIYSLKRQNSTSSVNSNLLDEKTKKPLTPENILPLLTKTIKINPKEIKNAPKNEISNLKNPRDISNRSAQKIVDKYRSLPSSRKVQVDRFRKNLKRSSSLPIDMPILPNSPTKSSETLEIGSPIDSPISNDWTTIMRRGLPEETKDELIAKHKPAENCLALKTPLLTASFRHFADPTFLQKDRQRVCSQNQLAAAISAVGKVFSMMEKENVTPEAIQTLGEAGKILADLHHENSVARRARITPEIGNFMEKVAGKNAVDRLLFEGNYLENFTVSRASTSGREIEMQRSGEQSQKVLRLKQKSAESKSDDGSDREFLASFEVLSDVISLMSDDSSPQKISDADFLECYLSSDNEDFDFEQKSKGRELSDPKVTSEDSSETTTAKKTQREVTQVRKTLFSPNGDEKSAETSVVDGNDNFWSRYSAARKDIEMPLLAATDDPEARQSVTIDSKSVTIPIDENTDFKQKSTREKICVSQRGSDDFPEVIFAVKPQPEVEEAIKTSFSSKKAEKCAADKNYQKIVFAELKTKEIPSSSANNDSAAIISQPATSGKVKLSILSKEAQKSVRMITEQETSKKQNNEKSFETNVAHIFRSPLPKFVQGNQSSTKSEQSDCPRFSKIVIKSDKLIKPTQKLTIHSGLPPKSVSFASLAIPLQGKQRKGTPWKTKSSKDTEFVLPSSTTPSQAKKQDAEPRNTASIDLRGSIVPINAPKDRLILPFKSGHESSESSSTSPKHWRSKNPETFFTVQPKILPWFSNSSSLSSSRNSRSEENLASETFYKKIKKQTTFKTSEKSSYASLREGNLEKGLSNDSRKLSRDEKTACKSPSKETLSQTLQKHSQESSEKNDERFKSSGAWYRKQRQFSAYGKPETVTLSRRNVEAPEIEDSEVPSKLRVLKKKIPSTSGIKLEKIENQDFPAPREGKRAEPRSSCEMKLEKRKPRSFEERRESRKHEKYASGEIELKKTVSRNFPALREFRGTEITNYEIELEKNKNRESKTPREFGRIEITQNYEIEREKKKNRDFKAPRECEKLEKRLSSKIPLEESKKVHFEAFQKPKKNKPLPSEIAPKNVDQNPENTRKRKRLIKGHKNFMQWFAQRQRISGNTDAEITPYRQTTSSENVATITSEIGESCSSQKSTLPTSGTQSNSSKASDTFSNDEIVVESSFWIPMCDGVEMLVDDPIKKTETVKRSDSPILSSNRAINLDSPQTGPSGLRPEDFRK